MNINLEARFNDKDNENKNDHVFVQLEMINRGGKMVEIVKHCAFGVPPIIIGHHLDEASVGTFYCNQYWTHPGWREGSDKETEKSQMDAWGNCLVGFTLLSGGALVSYCFRCKTSKCCDYSGGQSTTGLDSRLLHQKGKEKKRGVSILLLSSF